MKYLIIIISFFTMFACSHGEGHLVTYIYRNATDRTVTVKSSCPIRREGIWATGIDSTFVISAGGKHGITYEGVGGYPTPLKWYSNPGRGDSTIVSNGEVFVVHRIRYKDELYLKESYRVISEKKNIRRCEFIFTDEFFENGEPLEP